MPEQDDNSRKVGAAVGFAITGGLLTGALACVGGLVSLVIGQGVGAGMCFLAAALAFGVIAYVLVSA